MISKTFITVVDLYDDKDIIDSTTNKVIGVEQFLVRKNIKLKANILLSDIRRFEQVVNENGNIKKQFTKLVLSDGSNITVKNTYDDIDKLLNQKQIGFKYGK